MRQDIESGKDDKTGLLNWIERVIESLIMLLVLGRREAVKSAGFFLDSRNFKKTVSRAVFPRESVAFMLSPRLSE